MPVNAAAHETAAFEASKEGMHLVPTMETTLFWSPTCPFSRRVRFAANLADATLTERIVAWENGAPSWYTQIHPAGSVPALQVGRDVIAESGVLIEYFGASHRLPFVSDDPVEAALQRSRAAWANPNVLRPVKTGEGHDGLDAALDEVESWFGDTVFLDGERPGLLDITLSQPLAATQTWDVDVGDRPHLRAWQDAIRALPAFAAIPETYDEVETTSMMLEA